MVPPPGFEPGRTLAAHQPPKLARLPISARGRGWGRKLLPPQVTALVAAASQDLIKQGVLARTRSQGGSVIGASLV